MELELELELELHWSRSVECRDQAARIREHRQHPCSWVLAFCAEAGHGDLIWPHCRLLAPLAHLLAVLPPTNLVTYIHLFHLGSCSEGLGRSSGLKVGRFYFELPVGHPPHDHSITHDHDALVGAIARIPQGLFV
jgi:hypothetical protein